ncbi:MAG: carboxypeptidase regulatory-like domain-containing protein [Bryobacteraceae bacterium]
MCSAGGSSAWSWALAVCLLGPPLFGQTTQGLISGRIFDSRTGRPVAGAGIAYSQVDLNVGGVARSDHLGNFALPLLSPGRYTLRIEAKGYQPLQMEEVELNVAGRLDFPFRLRPLNDVWESGQYRSVFLPQSETVLDFYGPDVDASRAGSFDPTRGSRARLETGLSQVISGNELRDLPLVGRDVYTLLVTQPGVTADAGTGRGLGLSINGQRPSSSNFLLDGVENNNYLITGPLTQIAPEAVGEYRVSTNNFSAEYGRTAGFLANAVSRAGGNEWHGIAYGYLRNDVLNANGFQQNAGGISRRPLKELQPGFSAGGPILRERLFASGAFEYLRLRSAGDPFLYRVPTRRFVDERTAPNSIARRLLEQTGVAVGADLTAYRESSPTSSLNRYLALPRLDYLAPGGKHRLMNRVALARRDQPDFSWNPYREYWMALEQDTLSVATAWTASWTPAITNEVRIGWSRDTLGFDRPVNQLDGRSIPILASASRLRPFSFEPARPDEDNRTPIVLPGGAGVPGAPILYGYRSQSRNWELVENLVWARGSHVWKFGGGWLDRRIDGFVSLGRDASYTFASLEDFGRDAPSLLFTGISRTDLPVFRKPDDNRTYRNRQWFLFAQDSFRISQRLTVNYGLRYEAFGAPRSAGSFHDAIVQLGQGGDLAQRIAGARIVPGGPGDLFVKDSNDVGVRFGLAYRLRQDSRTSVRAAYGIFHDRPFDNLWLSLRANSVAVPLFQLASFFDIPEKLNYLADPLTVISQFQGQPLNLSVPAPVLFQPGFRSTYAQSYYAGLSHEVSSALSVELSLLGSLGRKLITTDVVNRDLSLPRTDNVDLKNPLRALNPDLPQINYRANQGLSSYQAMAVTARYRTERALLNLSYTWGRWIDNQSEALNGDLTNLSFSGLAGGGGGGRSAFTRQFDSRSDRASSDYDQRHNLVFYSVWRPPSFRNNWLLRDWQFAQMAAIRSGLPFSVLASAAAVAFDGETLVNNRGDVVDPNRTGASASSDGGRLILNRSAFAEPKAGTLGNTGRNAFRGPGFYGLDLSVSRFFRLRRLGETGRLTVRADAFNVLNHANLNNPQNRLDAQDPDFGEAPFGRTGRGSNFPALSPLDETARQVQILLRIEF